MQVEVLKSKIHRAKVTQADLNYVGSITLDANLMEAAEMFENQKVQILNADNGERFWTYVIPGEKGSGVVCLNGPAARKVQVGDTVLVLAYGLVELEIAPSIKPVIVFPGENNQPN